MCRHERNGQKDKGQNAQAVAPVNAEPRDSMRGSGGMTSADNILCEGADDEDGSLGAPPSICDGGAIRSLHDELPTELWSSRDGTGKCAGVNCTYDLKAAKIFAELKAKGTAQIGERALKSTIKQLFDLAEAYRFKRIVIGLGFEFIGNPDIVCTFLYYGFETLPLGKSPWPNIGLMLDFVTGFIPEQEQLASDTSALSSTSPDDLGCPDSDGSFD
mmetsp:Transcript_86443/g.241898  ORF Transcript_86443/g.241898 Transcript_86443/m.241898 type:complete len:216 (+) Transcript_86443:169-816(+)